MQVPKGINIMCRTKDGRVSFEVATMIEAHQRALNKKIQVYVVWAPPDAKGVWISVWTRIVMHFKTAKGEEVPSVRKARETLTKEDRTEPQYIIAL